MVIVESESGSVRLLTIMNSSRDARSGMPTASANLSREPRKQGWTVDQSFVEDAPWPARRAKNYIGFGLSVPRMVARAPTGTDRGVRRRIDEGWPQCRRSNPRRRQCARRRDSPGSGRSRSFPR